MIQGLGYLLSNITDYKELTNLAQNGDRDAIDLKVKHIYKDTEPPIPGDLTAANFGNVLHQIISLHQLTNLPLQLASLVKLYNYGYYIST